MQNMAQLPDIAVEVTDLAKSYGFVVALKSVNFRIESGQVFALCQGAGQEAAGRGKSQ